MNSAQDVASIQSFTLLSTGTDATSRVSLTIEQEFANLEASYTKMANEFSEDPAMEKYLEAYRMLFDYTFQAHEKQLGLLDIQNRIESTNAQLEANYDRIVVDDLDINTMKTTIVSNRQQLDDVHASEQAAMEIIDNLRHTIRSLNSELEFRQRIGKTVDEEATTKMRTNVERENLKLGYEVTQLTGRLEQTLNYQDELEIRADNADFKIMDVSTKLDNAKDTMVRLKRNKATLEMEVRRKKNELTELDITINDQYVCTDTAYKEAEGRRDAVQNRIECVNKCQHALVTWGKRCGRLQDEYNAMVDRTRTVLAEQRIAECNLRMHHRINNEIQMDINLCVLQRKEAERGVRHFQRQRDETCEQLNAARRSYNERKVDLSVLAQANEVQKREIHAHQRLVQRAKKDVGQMKEATKRDLNTIWMAKDANRKAVMTLDMFALEKRRKIKEVNYLEQERNRLADDAVDVQIVAETVNDSLHVCRVQILAQKRNLTQQRHHARQQATMVELCQAERKLNAAMLADRQESQRLLQLMLNEKMLTISVSNNAISGKESTMAISRRETEMLRNEMNLMVAAYKEASAQRRELRGELAAHRIKERRIVRQLDAIDFRVRDQLKLIVSLKNEADILHRQTVLRNGELLLLYDKCVLLKKLLKQGATQYDTRLNDIVLLKKDVKVLRQRKQQYTSNMSNMNDMNVELYHLSRDINTEQLKMAALRDELRYPLNVHYWHRMEFSDPEKYALLEIINALQKRVTRVNRAIEEYSIKVLEMTTLHEGLRHMVCKQSGPVLYERLNETAARLCDSRQYTDITMEQVQQLQVVYAISKDRLAEMERRVRGVRKEQIALKKARRQIAEKLRTAGFTRKEIRQIRGRFAPAPAKKNDRGDDAD